VEFEWEKIPMQKIYINVKYLSTLAGKNLSDLAEHAGVSQGAIYKWREGKPSANTLRRLAQYFSKELKIPYELFHDGRALVEEDFETTLIDAGWRKNGMQPGAPKFMINGRNIVEEEADLILNLSSLIKGDTDIPLTHSDTALVFALVQAMYRPYKRHQKSIRRSERLQGDDAEESSGADTDPGHVEGETASPADTKDRQN
jgi:transcriptional regulator with XRE-family HTH domain